MYLLSWTKLVQQSKVKEVVNVIKPHIDYENPAFKVIQEVEAMEDM